MGNEGITKGLENKPSQCKRILKHIEQYGSISTMQAIMTYGIVNPHARIMELRRAGHPIVTTMHEGVNRFDEPCRYAVYTLKKGVK